MKGFGKNNNKNKFYKEFIPPSIEERINKAIKYYKYCLDNGSKDPRILCDYGLILRDMGDFKSAQSMMEKSIEICKLIAIHKLLIKVEFN